MSIYSYIFEHFLIAYKIPPLTRYASGTAFVMSVSGAAACGKTWFCRHMVNFLADCGTLAVHVPLDGFLLNRKARNKRGLSGYDQKTYDLSRMIAHMKSLIYEEKPIEIPTYNHQTGEHETPRRIEHASVILLDGIMSMHSKIRKRFPNFKFFFTGEDIVIHGLRFMVDLKERGYKVFQALTHFNKEFASYKKWVCSQITFADLKIRAEKDRKLSII